MRLQLIKTETKLKCERCKNNFGLFGTINETTGITRLIMMKCKCHKKKINIEFHKDLDWEEKKKIITEYIVDIISKNDNLELWHQPK